MESKDRTLPPALVAALWCAACCSLLGCQGWNRPLARDRFDPETPIAQVGYAEDDAPENAEQSISEKTKRGAKSMMNFITLKEQEDLDRAKALYQQGDQLFRRAQSQPAAEAKATFAESAKLFERAGEAAPKTALEQDALFMQGESLFFADRLTAAADVYQKLQKEYPRNRHIDRVAARLFAISQYWVDVAKTQEGKWFTLNLMDAKRPRLDVDGHAIRVLDQIRFDDPTGRLADDATMAAAAEYIRQKKFVEADEFLTDLRETFADSEHLFHAHLLGIKCKLEAYAGPAYSGLVLDEAEKLVKQTRQRFPDKLSEPQYAEMVDRAAAEIARHRADRLAFRAKYNEDRRNYGASRYYYNELLKQFNNTPHADQARTRLAQIESYPAIPETRLSWLTTIFPDSRAKDPLEMTDGTAEPTEQPAAETILR
jgi:outer membrane protein assembly factor BamD (BamD/ComL family)